MDHLIINPVNPGFYYSASYLAAIIIGFGILMVEGQRRKFPVIPWLMVVATAFLFFMAGCRIIAFTEREWAYVLRLESIPYQTARSVLGGIIFSVPGILIARKFLRFNAEMTDAFAFVLPMALVVQRFGCLAAGCCYGTPSNLPWAVQYTNYSSVYADHLHSGLLPLGSALSAPIHPVQVYEIICAAVIVLTLVSLRQRLHAPGNLFLASFTLYGVFRFCLEFFRAPAGHTIGGTLSNGLTLVQWSIAVVIPIALLVIFFRERNRTRVVPSLTNQNILRQAIYAVTFATLFVIVSPWLGKDEIISINIVVVPMVAIIAWRLYTSITVPGLRLATLVLPVASLTLMSQTYPETTKERKSYSTVSLGISGGRTELQDTETTGGYTYVSNCNGGGSYQPNTITTNSNNHYSTTSIGVSHTVQTDAEKSFTFGVSAFSGTHNELFVQTTTGAPNSVFAENNYHYQAIKPYVQTDYRDFGLGLGLSMGQSGEFSHNFDNNTAVRKNDFLPSFSIRTGRLSKFFVEYKWNNQFTPSMPAMTHQGTIGIALGKSGGVLRIGTGSYVSFIMASYLPLGKNLVFEPYIGLGGGITKWKSSTSLVGSISMHYKFGRK